MKARRDRDAKWPGGEGNIRFFLDTKSMNDNKRWGPELSTIRAVISYIKSIGRLIRVYTPPTYHT